MNRPNQTRVDSDFGETAAVGISRPVYPFVTADVRIVAEIEMACTTVFRHAAGAGDIRVTNGLSTVVYQYPAIDRSKRAKSFIA